jgi:hypothetical protein
MSWRLSSAVPQFSKVAGRNQAGTSEASGKNRESLIRKMTAFLPHSVTKYRAGLWLVQIFLAIKACSPDLHTLTDKRGGKFMGQVYGLKSMV